MTTTEAEADEAARSGGFVVGKTSVYVVGLEGEVTAHTDGTVTLCGFTLPTRLNSEGGVKYLSTEWPPDPAPAMLADHDDCAGGEAARAAAEARELRFVDDITTLHDENHEGAFPTCMHAVCRRAGGRW